MRLIIYIPKEKYEMFLNGGYAGLLDNDLYYDIKNGTPIPDNATNGDVIMAMFSTVDTYFSNVIDMKLWWKAKYKGAGEIQCIPTDEEIAKSFIEDVEAVKDLLPRAESEDKE